MTTGPVLGHATICASTTWPFVGSANPSPSGGKARCRDRWARRRLAGPMRLEARFGLHAASVNKLLGSGANPSRSRFCDRPTMGPTGAMGAQPHRQSGAPRQQGYAGRMPTIANSWLRRTPMPTVHTDPKRPMSELDTTDRPSAATCPPQDTVVDEDTGPASPQARLMRVVLLPTRGADGQCLSYIGREPNFTMPPRHAIHMSAAKRQQVSLRRGGAGGADDPPDWSTMRPQTGSPVDRKHG